jgi:hypothetical protein
MTTRERAESVVAGWQNSRYGITLSERQAGSLRNAITEALAAQRERDAGIAERDVDWTRFGKTHLPQWENGADDIRDYRLGIAAGRAIAAAIRGQDHINYTPPEWRKYTCGCTVMPYCTTHGAEVDTAIRQQDKGEPG